MSGTNSSGRDSPLVPTALDAAVSDAAQRAAQRRTRSGRIKMLLLLALFVAPVAASYIAYYVIRPEGRTNYGTLIQPTRALPALPLATLDVDGRSGIVNGHRPGTHTEWPVSRRWSAGLVKVCSMSAHPHGRIIHPSSRLGQTLNKP